MSSIHEECGVAGIFSDEHAVQKTKVCLHHLQHRGQEGCGIAACDFEGRLECVKGLGLVSDVFEKQDNHFNHLEGWSAIGHVRYGTSGGRGLENVQPFVFRCRSGTFSIAHNGNIINSEELKTRLCKEGTVFSSSSDSEIIAHLIYKYGIADGHDMESAILNAMNQLDGAVSLLVLTQDALYACRDRYGFRPLSMGKLTGGYAFASESSALNALSADDVRDIAPGEIVTADRKGLHSRKANLCLSSKLCAMEYIYFARPDSDIEGVCVYSFRKNLGRILFEEKPTDADIVIAVPDSGNSAAIGYAEASGLPLEMGLIKNRYVGRTFIQPNQKMREIGVRMKLSPLSSVIKGKRLVLIDDSIVRGATSRKTVSLLRDAGAAEIHARISSPMITAPCFYGVDISSSGELLCAGRTLEECRTAIGADSLAFISEEGLLRAGSRKDLCMACFNMKYPTNLYNNNI